VLRSVSNAPGDVDERSGSQTVAAERVGAVPLVKGCGLAVAVAVAVVAAAAAVVVVVAAAAAAAVDGGGGGFVGRQGNSERAYVLLDDSAREMLLGRTHKNRKIDWELVVNRYVGRQVVACTHLVRWSANVMCNGHGREAYRIVDQVQPATIDNMKVRAILRPIEPSISSANTTTYYQPAIHYYWSIHY